MGHFNGLWATPIVDIARKLWRGNANTRRPGGKLPERGSQGQEGINRHRRGGPNRLSNHVDFCPAPISRRAGKRGAALMNDVNSGFGVLGARLLAGVSMVALGMAAAPAFAQEAPAPAP